MTTDYVKLAMQDAWNIAHEYSTDLWCWWCANGELPSDIDEIDPDAMRSYQEESYTLLEAAELFSQRPVGCKPSDEEMRAKGLWYPSIAPDYAICLQAAHTYANLVALKFDSACYEMQERLEGTVSIEVGHAQIEIYSALMSDEYKPTTTDEEQLYHLAVAEVKHNKWDAFLNLCDFWEAKGTHPPDDIEYFREIIREAKE